MPEYGDYEKEIKTLGDLRTFVNETLKGIEDNYTFDIDDDFMGLDIILKANCDVSYSEKSFYWCAKVNYVNDVVKVVNDSLNAKHKIKALDIIKEKDVDIYILNHCKTVDEYNSKIVHIIGEIRELTQEEFDLLKRC